MSPRPDPWLVRRPLGTPPSWRLLCVPHAGAGAAALASWFAAVPPECEVVVVRLPGRESRLSEPAVDSVDAAANGVLAAWRPLLDLPYVVFGYSMGAVIGYELTRLLLAETLAAPTLLAVGGHGAPQRPNERAAIHDLPDGEFIEALRRLGGTPDEVLAHPDLFALLSPTLRADLRLIDTYTHRPGPPVTVPVATYTAVDDRDVAWADVQAWDEVAAAPCVHRRFTGGHFFFTGAESSLLDEVVADYRDLRAGRGLSRSPVAG